MDSVTAKAAAQPRVRSTLWFGALLICGLFGYIFFATAWLGDDAFISMKQVWNAVPCSYDTAFFTAPNPSP